VLFSYDELVMLFPHMVCLTVASPKVALQLFSDLKRKKEPSLKDLNPFLHSDGLRRELRFGDAVKGQGQCAEGESKEEKSLSFLPCRWLSRSCLMRWEEGVHMLKVEIRVTMATT
jgi:hypothetical protein